MSKINQVTPKISRNADGRPFSYSLEVVVSCDDNADFLTAEQIQMMTDLANQAKNISDDIVKGWIANDMPANAPQKPQNQQQPVGFGSAPADGKVGYDRARKWWDACECGNRDVTTTTKDGTRQYQRCKNCRIYLNSDGTTKQMPAPGQR